MAGRGGVKRQVEADASFEVEQLDAAVLQPDSRNAVADADLASARTALQCLGGLLNAVADLPVACGEIARSAKELLDANDTLILLREACGGFREATSGEIPADAITLVPSHPIAELLASNSEPLWMRREPDGAPSDSASVFLGGLGWDFCIPLVDGEEVHGILAGRGPGAARLTAWRAEFVEVFRRTAGLTLAGLRHRDDLERLRIAATEAAQLASLGKLVASVAHEIRNPLVSIQTFFQLAPQQLDDEEFRTSFLGLAGEEVNRLCVLVGELLGAARTAPAPAATVDLDEIIDGLLRLVGPQARQADLQLVWTPAADAVTVRIDSGRLKQVLLNLVLNAIEATPAGGEIVLSTCTINDPAGSFGQIEVRDTGAGIPVDQHSFIFKPFFTTRTGGTGLGLAIVQEIVNASGGRIELESVVGKGSTFRVFLPHSSEKLEP